MMRIDIITLFPEMLSGYVGSSMMKRAAEAEAVEFNFINPRDFTTDKHQMTDDRPYGGGPGMVMKPEPLFAAVESVKSVESRVILLSPSGTPFKQEIAQQLACNRSHLIFICGHYEGIDERVREALVDEELSIGDYVLTNGALAAAVVSDAVVRLLPGVLGGGEMAREDESFATGFLDYPQYTRPPIYRDMEVPALLLSGDHAAVEAWRRAAARERTASRRPDLWSNSDEKGENNA